MPSQYTNLYNRTPLNCSTNQNEDINYPIKAFVQKRKGLIKRTIYQMSKLKGRCRYIINLL